jgi:hypothetical protein
MLSQKSKYAVKAAIALAREFGQGPALISDIAQRERIPRKDALHSAIDNSLQLQVLARAKTGFRRRGRDQDLWEIL